jgi:hypothetical protein
MKNKIFEVFVCMLLIGTCFVVTTNMVSAEDLVEGDYTYTVSNGQATLTKYTGAGGNITIPTALGGYPTVHIGNGAFGGASGNLITSVIIPDSVTTIGDSAFVCAMTSVTIGNGVTTIGYAAFSATHLTSVTIPNSVIIIGISAFSPCRSLTSVTIGSGVTTIKQSAFGDDSALAFVNIPDSVTTIEMTAFSACKLTSLTIGSGVITIGNGAFAYCPLTSITFLGLVAPTTVGTGWIGNTPAEIRGHAYSNSNFPAPGNMWNNLTMGDYIVNENKPPVAGFTWTPSTPKANQTVTFDASTSNDTDGSIIKYEWDWNNDGTYEDSKTTLTATNSWTQAGSYPVTLRVTDNSNATNTKKITITVSSGGENGGTDNKKTPGFELILVILAITMIMFLKRKRKNSD